MVIETERAEIEARAKVTERMRPLRIGGREVHQVALPWHWGFGGASRRVTARTTSARWQRPERVDPGGQGVHLQRARRARADGRDDRASSRACTPPAMPNRAATRRRRTPRRHDRDRRPRADAERMGFFTDTTVCIGCKACEVACKQWNDLPSDGGTFRKGGSYDNTGSLVGQHVAPRALRRARRRRRRRPRGGDPGSGGDGRGERLADRCRGGRGGVRQLGLHVRRLQALHERRLPRRVPDGRADPHGVRDRGAPARRLQRLRLLHPGLPVRRRRPRPEDGRAAQVHPLLRPARGRAGAGLREGVPDRLDPVRPLRRARRGRQAAASPTLHARGVEGAYLYGAGDAPERPARRRPRRVLPAHRDARALRPARPGRLADPGERRARRRWPRWAPGCSPPPASPPRSCGRRRDERRIRARRRHGPRRPRSASAAARTIELHKRACGDGPLVLPLRRGHGLRRRDARPRGESRQAARDARGGELPDVVQGPIINAAGVDLGGPALLLVRRHRGRLVVRGARLRPGRRRATRPRSRARSRSAALAPVARRC